jgi:hypothetical protein
MANISINLSSNVVTLQNVTTKPTTLGESISLFFNTAASLNSIYPYYSSYSQVGSSLRLNYSDGAYTNYNNVVLANPNASSGTATATSIEVYAPSALRLTVGGQLNYQYKAASNGPDFEGTGGTITSAAIQTLLPTYSPNYNAAAGNVTVGMQGNIKLTAADDISGVVTTLTAQADKMLQSSTLTGTFNISGNTTNIALNLSKLAVSGVVNDYNIKYTDGSSISMSNVAMQVNADSVVNQTLLANGANLPGDDVINVTLGAVATSPWSIASGAGNDKVTIKGGGSSLSVNAGIGNDVITLGDSNHAVDGGAGIDTAVFSGARAAYAITKTVDGYSVKSSGGTDTLAGVERVQFSDSTLALDISGNGGQVYRLYQAAFNRVPDAGGLGYWIKAMDNGASLQTIAAEFIKSDESKAMYGANPNNADFLDKLYHNVLHRAGDKAGYDWWLGHMNAGDTSQAAALAEFGESAENQAALIGSIGNGFTFTPYG